MKKNSDANIILLCWMWVFIGGLVAANLILQGNVIRLEERISKNAISINELYDDVNALCKTTLANINRIDYAIDNQEAKIKSIREKKWFR